MNQSVKSITLSACIPEDLAGLRVDLALSRLFPEYSRSQIQQWIEDEQVWVDGQLRRPKHKVLARQQIEVRAQLAVVNAIWQAQEIDIPLLYVDEHFFIINKPAGLVVHPAPGNPDRTLVNALLHLDPELAKLPRAGVVHRLDKDTSGIMVVARTLIAHHHLVKQIQARSINREYLAVVNGVVTGGGTVDAAIGRHSSVRVRMAVVESGKAAVTHYRLLERFRAHSYLRVILETGRTHQIRVHMAHVTHPIVGDPLYGGRLQLPKNCSAQLKLALGSFKRQCLHAQRLTLAHPLTGETMSWEAPLPEDFLSLLAELTQDKRLNTG